MSLSTHWRLHTLTNWHMNTVILLVSRHIDTLVHLFDTDTRLTNVVSVLRSHVNLVDTLTQCDTLTHWQCSVSVEVSCEYRWHFHTVWYIDALTLRVSLHIDTLAYLFDTDNTLTNVLSVLKSLGSRSHTLTNWHINTVILWVSRHIDAFTHWQIDIWTQ